jgi:hypothetical protein
MHSCEVIPQTRKKNISIFYVSLSQKRQFKFQIQLSIVIFASMSAKKYMVYLLLFAFLMARVEPVFPYLKAVPKVTRNLITNVTSFCTGSDKVSLLSDIDIDDQDDQNNKEAEKESEKEVGKSVKEECKMLPNDHVADLIFSANSTQTLFHLYLSGKERTHVNEVFRPPLV